MDPLAFLSWQFVMFSLIVATLMFLLRTVLEYFIPKLSDLKIWRSLLLMILPVFIGAGLGWVFKIYPYATGFDSTALHICYGAVAGLLSTILFKVIKEMLVGRISGMITGITNGINGNNNNPPTNNGGMSSGTPPQNP